MNEGARGSANKVKAALLEWQGQDPEWEHSPLAAELGRWVGIFHTEWELDLPVLPTLAYEPIRNAYGTYQPRYGALGLPDVVTINTAMLERPSAHIVRTLGHELLHLWQHYHGKPSKQRNYHNDEYVAKAKSVGILIDAQGCTCGHTEAFSRLITKHGIHLPTVREDDDGTLIATTAGVEQKVYGTRTANGGGSKMKKWACGCTIVRCAVALSARCNACGDAFRQEKKDDE